MTPLHSYRDNKVAEQRITFVLFEVYRNIVTRPTRTAARAKDATQRSLQQVTTPFPHLAFKDASLKPFREFGGFLGHEPPVLLARPCNKPFSAPNADVSVLFGLTVRQAHGLAFGNTLLGTYHHENLPDLLESGRLHGVEMGSPSSWSQVYR